MRRREFITLLGGAAAARPMGAEAQQVLPVVGFFNAGTPEANADRVRGFQQGLREAGFVDGDNVTILYRWGENHPDRLPALAADLVRRRVSVLASHGDAPALAAKTATAGIPIVFAVGQDPVRTGLVASLARPGGNATGINYLNTELVAKRLELLREMVPRAAKIAVLVVPAVPQTETITQDVEAATRLLGLQNQVLKASSSAEINAVFATFARERPDALFVANAFLFNNRRVQLVHLATRYAIPASYSGREYVEAGGLMSYGASGTESYRQVGFYTGRILKGAKPTDLPVVQSTKFELVINAETARLLGLTVPPLLLTIADEVIE